VRQQLPQPDHGARNVHQRQVVPSGLLESRRQTPEPLQVMEEALDQVPTAICPAVQRQLGAPGGVGVNHRLHSPPFDATPDGIRVISRVCDHRFPASVRVDDRFRDRRLVLLARGEFNMEGKPLRVDERMDLGREPTS